MITGTLFDSLFPTRGLNPRKYNLVRNRAELIDALNRILPKYEINNYLRVCAFLGNCGIETDYFKTTVEYASGDDYDTRASLGNTPQRDGDGRKYKGRGLTQTTGKYNYEQLTKAVGKEVGIDFVKNPERLAEVEIAVLSACVFWKDHNLNAYADKGLFKQLSAIVNRGDKNLTPLHWAKRNELYSLCKRRVPQNFSFDALAQATPIDDPNPPQSIVMLAGKEPLAVTPAEPAVEPRSDDSFLAAALDKNVSSEEARAAVRSHAPKILLKFSRPFVLLYGALEAGNIAAWLGTVCGTLVVLYLIYAHRSDLKKIIETVKTKFLQQ